MLASALVGRRGRCGTMTAPQWEMMDKAETVESMQLMTWDHMSLVMILPTMTEVAQEMIRVSVPEVAATMWEMLRRQEVTGTAVGTATFWPFSD